MNSVKSIVYALLVLAGLAGSALAGPVTIADYAGEFMKSTSSGLTRPSLSADGWNYMYSSTSSIGTQASYANLLTTGNLANKFWQYTIDGNWPSQVVGAEYLNLGASA